MGKNEEIVEALEEKCSFNLEKVSLVITFSIVIFYLSDVQHHFFQLCISRDTELFYQHHT